MRPVDIPAIKEEIDFLESEALTEIRARLYEDTLKLWI